MRIALDTNCVLDLVGSTRFATDLSVLVAAHASNELTLCVPAISGSEWQRGGGTRPSFAEFEKLLVEAGLQTAELLFPVMHFNATYWDRAVWGSEQFAEEMARIHGVLFPSAPYGWKEHCELEGLDFRSAPIDRKFLNRLCDTSVLWCHIHYQTHALVTRDGNFTKATKLPRLRELGASDIWTPKEAVENLRLGKQGAV